MKTYQQIVDDGRKILNSSYDERVRTRFPCPEGYEELNQFDTAKEIYDRLTLKASKLLNWRDERYIVTLKNQTMEIQESHCWFVKKQIPIDRGEWYKNSSLLPAEDF